MSRIVFLHGLNTWGDDELHLGPLTFGSMGEPWQRALIARGFDVFCVTGAGHGEPSDQARRALESLQSVGFLKDPAGFVLLGHSVGGLVARVLTHEGATQSLIRGVLTLGSPHRGTETANLGLGFKSEFPRLARLASVIGYDVSKRGAAFHPYTAERMRSFDHRYPMIQSIPSAHALFDVRPEDLSWPLKLMHPRLHPTNEASDGFIHCTSQEFGDSIGRFNLDHFGNTGYFFQLSPVRRQRARSEFKRLADAVAEWARSCFVSDRDAAGGVARSRTSRP